MAWVWGGLVGVALISGVVATSGGVSAFDAATPEAGTPTAEASPAGTPLPPLYTPIPAAAARNVVGKVTIELTDRGFVPSRFENAINQEIQFTLVNTGTRPHTFTIDALDVDVALAPGETKRLTIPSPRRLGQYAYYSDTPLDRELGMTGIMTIFI